jgi:hypothetical protein
MNLKITDQSKKILNFLNKSKKYRVIIIEKIRLEFIYVRNSDSVRQIRKKLNDLNNVCNR